VSDLHVPASVKAHSGMATRGSRMLRYAPSPLLRGLSFSCQCGRSLAGEHVTTMAVSACNWEWRGHLVGGDGGIHRQSGSAGDE
jgi:hypothetical protein